MKFMRRWRKYIKHMLLRYLNMRGLQPKQNVVDSGYFENLRCEQMSCKVTYDIDSYLNLVSTLRKIPLEIKEPLFAGLKEELQSFGDRLELSFLSAVQVAIKTNILLSDDGN